MIHCQDNSEIRSASEQSIWDSSKEINKRTRFFKAKKKYFSRAHTHVQSNDDPFYYLSVLFLPKAKNDAIPIHFDWVNDKKKKLKTDHLWMWSHNTNRRIKRDFHSVRGREKERKTTARIHRNSHDATAWSVAQFLCVFILFHFGCLEKRCFLPPMTLQDVYLHFFFRQYFVSYFALCMQHSRKESERKSSTMLNQPLVLSIEDTHSVRAHSATVNHPTTISNAHHHQ